MKIKQSLSMFPELISEIDVSKNILDTQKVGASDKRKIWWVGKKCGHQWLMPIASRTKSNCNCPICSNHVILKGFNDLEFINPEVASRWHPTKNGTLKPSEVSTASGKKVWWLCDECSQSWIARIYDRTLHKSGCPYCNNRLPLKGKTDLQTLHPLVAKQLHPKKNNGLKSDEISASSHKKVWWICLINEKHEWLASPNVRINRIWKKDSCPFCTGRKIFSGDNDLLANFPNVSKEWHPTKNGTLKPSEVSTASGKKVWWLCDECSHEWKAVIANRTRLKHHCPVCADKKRKDTLKNKSIEEIEQRLSKTRITNLERYGVEYPAQNPKVALKQARSANLITDIFHWKTGENIACQGGWEAKIVNYLNENKINYVWQLMFKVPMDEFKTKKGRQSTYRVDAYLPDKNLYIEIKGRFYDEESRLKWEWFHKTYPNSELWDGRKIKSLGIDIKYPEKLKF